MALNCSDIFQIIFWNISFLNKLLITLLLSYVWLKPPPPHSQAILAMDKTFFCP